MHKLIKKQINIIIENLFGKLKYEIEVISIDGSRSNFVIFYDIRSVDEYVNMINKEKYYMIVNIKKYRQLNFIYKKEILSKPPLVF